MSFAAASNARRAKDECLVGIWSADLPYSLLWCTPAYGEQAASTGCPTWLWASIAGPVQMPGHYHSSIQVRTNAEAQIVWTSATWAALPLISALKSVELTLLGRLQQARVGLSTAKQEWWEVSKVFSASGKETFDMFSIPKPREPFGDGFIGTASFDIAPPERGTVFACLQIGFTHPQSRFNSGNDPGTITSADHYFLILKPTRGVSEYRRVGMDMVRIEIHDWGRGSHARYVVNNRTFPPAKPALLKMVNEDLPNDRSWGGFSDESARVEVHLV